MSLGLAVYFCLAVSLGVSTSFGLAASLVDLLGSSFTSSFLPDLTYFSLVFLADYFPLSYFAGVFFNGDFELFPFIGLFFGASSDYSSISTSSSS
jgi:hypothetical protein